MALFRRKQPGVDTVPQEVREYYQSERRERAGVAWLLALGTLVVTLLLASGIFFGGRWVYRTLTNGNKQGGTQQAQNQNDNKSKDGKGQGTGTGTSSTNTPTPSTNGGSAGTPQGNTQPANGGVASSPPQSPATTPATGADSAATSSSQANASAQLANTGPGDTVAVFVAATLVGAGAHYYVTTRRSAR